VYLYSLDCFDMPLSISSQIAIIRRRGSNWCIVLSDWLLLNVKWKVFQLYSAKWLDLSTSKKI